MCAAPQVSAREYLEAALSPQEGGSPAIEAKNSVSAGAASEQDEILVPSPLGGARAGAASS